MTKNINIEIQKIFNLALENYEKKNFKVALNLYREIIKINPNHAESYYNLGLIFHSLKKLEKAISSEALDSLGFWNKLNSPTTSMTITPHIMKFFKFIYDLR